MTDSPFVIAGRTFQSRLIIGTGKYSSHAVMARAHEASGADVVTVAVRRVNISDRSRESLLDYIDTNRMFILPNTAGCYTADEAIGKQLQEWTTFVARLGPRFSLEMRGGAFTLLPDTKPVAVLGLGDDPSEAMRQALDQLAGLFAGYERTQLFSTLRSSEYRPGREVQSMYTIAGGQVGVRVGLGQRGREGQHLVRVRHHAVLPHADRLPLHHPRADRSLHPARADRERRHAAHLQHLGVVRGDVQPEIPAPRGAADRRAGPGSGLGHGGCRPAAVPVALSRRGAWKRARRDGAERPDPLERSALEAAIQSVPGVLAVRSVRIRRRGFFNWQDFTGLTYEVADDEVVRVRNDPDHPDHEYSVSYRAWVRADGTLATISKLSTDDDVHDLAEGEIREFNAYPALSADAGADVQGAEDTDPVSNSVKFSCVFTEDEEGGAPTAELRLWVNDELAVSAVDNTPYPAEYNGHQAVQRQAIQYERGQSTEPVRVLFESFRLDEILDG